MIFRKKRENKMQNVNWRTMVSNEKTSRSDATGAESIFRSSKHHLSQKGLKIIK
jgi:hypothetical protein